MRDKSNDKPIIETGNRILSEINKLCDGQPIGVLSFVATKFYALVCIHATITKQQAHAQADTWLEPVQYIIRMQYDTLKSMGNTEIQQ